MASRPPPIRPGVDANGRPDGSDLVALGARLVWIRTLTHDGRANVALAVEALADVVETLVGLQDRPGSP